jgi:hypothetical protein
MIPYLYIQCDSNIIPVDNKEKICNPSVVLFSSDNIAHKVSRPIAFDSWVKFDLKNILISELVIEGRYLIDDISIMYDSDLDNQVNSKDQIGLAKILEQVIDDILEKNVEQDDP